jgi:hypothetical protein
MPSSEVARPEPDYRSVLAAYDWARQQCEQRPSDQNVARLWVAEQWLYQEVLKPGKFDLGQIVATPGSLSIIEEAGQIPPEFVLRHKHGDWGDLDPEDRRVNEEALRRDQRLLSAYHTRLDEKLWIITEWDRSVTTLLLPEEY